MSEKIQELFKLKLAGALSQQRNEIIKPIETSETTELLRTEFLTRQAFRDAYRRAVENKSSLEKIYQKWDDYQKACREVPEDFS